MSQQNGKISETEGLKMERKAIWILPDGTAIRITIPVQSLPFLQKKVGGLIDSIYIPNHQKSTLWANDEGLILNMEPNMVASYIAKQPIVGPVVVEGETILKALERDAIILDSITDVIGDFFETTGYD